MEPSAQIPHSINIETVGWGSEGTLVLKEIGSFLGQCGITVHCWIPSAPLELLITAPGDGRFSDTALARSDRYDVGYVARHGRFVRSLRFLGSGLLNNNGDGSFQGGKILFQQCLNLPFDLQGEGIAHFGEIQGDGYLVAGSRNLFDESALDKTVLGLRMEDTVE